MSFYDDASLIMIPSGVKAGTVYSQKPMDSTGQFTFTRASEATRLVDGVVTKVRTNSILQSNDLDTTWAVTNATVTGGQADKDGGTDAWLLSKTASGGFIYQNTSSYSGVYTVSVYAKANADNYIKVNGNAVVDGEAFFNLSNGTLQSSINCIATSIEAVGDGWYRCSITSSDTNLSYVNIYPASGTGIGPSTGSIYIQSAQLEAGTVATPYIATTTVAVSEGPVANMPRLNSVAGGCPSLLLEPQRTQLVLRYDKGNYGNDPASEILTESPEGYNNAFRPVPDAPADRYQQDISGGTYATDSKLTYSWYRKRISTPVDASFIGDLDVKGLANVTQVGVTEEIESGINGFDRFAAVFNITDGAVTSTIRLYFGGVIGAGNSSVAYFGHQLEEGSYSTSIIPSYGTAATRVADACYKTGITSLIGQTEGVVFLDVGTIHNNSETGPTKWFFEVIKDASNSFGIGSGGADAAPAIRFVTNIVGVVTTESEPAGFSNSKIAIKYNASEFKLFQNGSLKATIAKNIGGYVDIQFMEGAGSALSMPLKQFLVFPTALTDAECITLTTL